MIAGAPHEARWLRAEPRRTLSAPLLERIVHTAFPRGRVVDVQPLADGLRNERASCPLVEPHFSDGYLHAGGRLPQQWRQLARLIDVTALCESLTHDQLPDGAVAELVELIRAVVENRDPRLA